MLARASYPTDRIHTVYHGAPIDEAPSAVGGFAFYAGRLSDEKGVETLLDAAKRAPHVPVVIAGDGPLAAHVRSASGDHLTYLGKLPWESVLRFRRNALLTVAPSHCYEALGLGAVESMAVGTPVVASALGGLSEIIEHGVSGLLVPPGDPSALAVALDALWSDRSGVAAMGQRAWGYAREHFDPAGQTLRLVELYEGLLPGR
jgi:glycosyltransferase involved in cell wall biosynthesis